MASTDNITLSCPPSFSSFLEELDRTFFQFNATTIDGVARCPRLCAEAWGQGNPDFSGIGVLIQAFLMLLFGPCLLAGYIFLPKRLQAKQVRDIQFEFLVGSSVLSVSVLTATAIYLFSTDQPFEQAFLYHLATMQFFALFTVWSTGIPIYSRTDGRTWWYGILYLIIEAAPYFLNFLIIVGISLHPAIPYFLLACIDDVDTGIPTSAPEYVIRAYKGDWIMTAVRENSQ